MKVNVKRKVGEINLQAREFLLPLFEVIVNGIHAIEESNNPNGLIRINIIRDKSQTSLNSNGFEAELPSIRGFQVSDNGIGFTDKHLEAFDEEYAEHKLEKGGKGVGRFTVLAAFNKMLVKSTYKNDGVFMERNFQFDVKEELKIIGSPIITESKHAGTIVDMDEYHLNFIDKTKISKESIAEKIVDHCLIYFLNETMPRCLITDDLDNRTIDLNDVYKNYTSTDGKPKVVALGESRQLFKLDFLKKYRERGTNRIHFCGNNREVEKVNIEDIIPSLENPFEDTKGKYYISVYVTGEYLDKNVISTRNAFRFPKASNEKDVFYVLSLEEILASVQVEIEKKYSKVIETVCNQTLEKVRNYIMFEGGVEYRHLLGKSDNFKHLSPNLSSDKIDEALHKLNFTLEKQHTKKLNRFLDKKRITNYDEFHTELKAILAEENNFSQSKLAHYVIRRKAIINLFEKLLNWDQKSKKYNLEKDLHNIIFPMGGDSDSISYNDHNLWLLDEKLTYHSYVSSDQKIKSNPTISSESNKETDLIIFEFPWAYSADSFSSLIVFEFKRPGREFNAEERKIDKQVINYFEDLSLSKAKDYQGRFLKIKKETPKFGYIVCDVTPDLESYLMGFGGGYRKTSSGTLYRYFEDISLYIEVTSFEQLLENAKIRHRAFFRHLGLQH